MKSSRTLVLSLFIIVPSLHAETFTYDDADRLLTETDGRTITYVTDPAGNITAVTVSGPAPLAAASAGSALANSARTTSGVVSMPKLGTLPLRSLRATHAGAASGASRKAADGTVVSLLPVAELAETGPLDFASGNPAFWRLVFFGGTGNTSINAEGEFASSLSRITLAPLTAEAGLSLELTRVDYFLLGEPLLEWAEATGPWVSLDWKESSDVFRVELPRHSAPSEFYLRIR